MGGMAVVADYQTYVREYFAEDAKTYDQRERLRRRMRRQLLRAAAPGPGERALDACTGTGEVALALAAAGAVVTGVDLSPDMLALAKRKAERAPVEFLTGDTTALPFPDKSFDLCTLSMGLHCMPADVRQGTLRELSRLARDRVVLLEPNTPRHWLGKTVLALLGRLQGSPRYWGEFIRTGLDDMLAEAGLAVERRIVFNAGIHMVIVCRPVAAPEG